MRETDHVVDAATLFLGRRGKVGELREHLPLDASDGRGHVGGQPGLAFRGGIPLRGAEHRARVTLEELLAAQRLVVVGVLRPEQEASPRQRPRLDGASIGHAQDPDMILHAEVRKAVDVVLEELIADGRFPGAGAEPVVGQSQGGELPQGLRRAVAKRFRDRIMAWRGVDLDVGVVRKAESELRVEAAAPRNTGREAVAETLGGAREGGAREATSRRVQLDGGALRKSHDGEGEAGVEAGELLDGRIL